MCRLLLAVLMILSGFLSAVGAEEPVRLRLATTTSVDNSGLMDFLIPVFQARNPGVRVEVLAVGTGKAIKLAERGDVDMILVHAPDLEEAFLKTGLGADPTWIMKNDFVLVGPREDPAGLKSTAGLEEALRRLKAAGASFVSRGDESGTHQKEKSLWRDVGGSPSVYLESGQGMCATLRIADEKRAYTLSDRGSCLACTAGLSLDIVFQGGASLENLYRVILVNPERYPHVHFREAKDFLLWLTSEEGQQRIGSFQKDGQVLFHPFRGPGVN